MSNTDYVTTLKILVIGESGVGKSSIILAFTTGDYNASFPATIGVDYKCKVMDVNGMKVKLGIWDTAGQERYRTLTSSFYREAHGAILVYDVSEPKSLAKLNEWVEELQVYSTKKNIVCLVVGNKIDKNRVVTREQGKAFAQKHRMLFIESSAKTQEGINLAFEELVQKNRVVTREQGKAFAQKHRMLFIESSAKTQEGINLAFEELVQKIIETPGLWETGGSSSNIRITNDANRSQEEESSCYSYSCTI